MTNYRYDTEFGVVTVEEFFPPYTNDVIEKVERYASENVRDGYQDNYSFNDDPASLGYLLRNNKLASIYFGYLDDEFQFFLATRIAEDTGMFLVLVRLFSKIERVKKPIHTAFILRLQMEMAGRLGFKECSFTMNTDTRDGLAELVKKRYLKYPHQPNSIKAIALENMSKFEYCGVQTVNFCDQHVFTAKIG